MWIGIKHMDDEAHRRLTGAGNRRILDNLRCLLYTSDAADE